MSLSAVPARTQRAGGEDREGVPLLKTPFEALPLVCVDVETTGLTPDKGARVCEIALLRSEGERHVARFESLVHPQQPMPPEVIAVHGITDAMVAEAPPFVALLPEIRDLMRDAVVVGHNVQFDLRFLRHEWHLAGGALPECVAIDTLALARTYFDFARNGLGAIAAALGIAHTAAHRAMGDVLATWNVLQHFVAELRRRGPVTLADLILPRMPDAAGAGIRDMVTALQDALPESAPLCIRYRAWHAPETVRVVQPLSVYFQRGYGFLHAFCHLRREERHFRLDRILELSPLGDE
jgi:DNA polymerase-3 subunit epsilon